MMSEAQKQFEQRIERLREEQAYIRPGWHVPVRTVRTHRLSFRLSLREWLMYPLFIARV
jgi:hypothetical protein